MSDRGGDAQDQDFRLQKHFPNVGLLDGLDGQRGVVLHRTRFRRIVVVRVGFLANRRSLRFVHRGDS